MASSKVTAMTEDTAPAITDLAYGVKNPGGTPLSRKLTWETIRTLLFRDGWVSAGETWVYTSATSFTVASIDLTGKYEVGDKIRLKQDAGTYKYYYIVSVTYTAEGSPNTSIVITGGTSYTLLNQTITSNYYSKEVSPNGFPNHLNWNGASGLNLQGNTATVEGTTFRMIGDLVVMNLNAYGVNNNTTQTGTAPIAAGAAVSNVIRTRDGTAYTWGRASIPASSVSFTFYTDAATGSFTSGTSGGLYSSYVVYRV